MRPVELKQVLKWRADLEKGAIDCTPGRHSGESKSSFKRGMSVFFIQKEERLDLTKPDANHYAKAAGLFIVL